MLKIQENISLAPYTTFKIGGLARYFSEAKSAEDLKELCQWLKEKNLPVFVLGGGSNILVSDKGFDGLVIKIENWKLEISARGGSASGGKDSIVECDAGVPLAKLVQESLKNGLSGLEWAIGIPGTIGGAINGNAGAFGKSISDVVEKVEIFNTSTLKPQIFTKQECKFSYRNSLFSVKGGSASGGKRNPNLIILSATLRLKKGDRDGMQRVTKDYIHQRMESNPVGYCAGCFFKNAEWPAEEKEKTKMIQSYPELEIFIGKPKISAGFLIEKVGLKGKKIGGALVSEKHANFIINTGDATAGDIINLADLIKKEVYSRYGIRLEEEVQLVGFD